MDAELNGASVKDAASWMVSITDRVMNTVLKDCLTYRWDGARVGTGGRSTAWMRHATKSCDIIYGRKAIEQIMRIGFRDYSSIHESMWGAEDVRGVDGLWALMVHEMAHLVRGKRRSIDSSLVHDQGFVEVVCAIKEMWPREDARNSWIKTMALRSLFS